jgi:hypothetical protein
MVERESRVIDKKFRAKNLKQYVRINRTVGIGRPSFQALVCIIPERRRHWIRRIQIRLVATLALGPNILLLGSTMMLMTSLPWLVKKADLWPTICTGNKIFRKRMKKNDLKKKLLALSLELRFCKIFIDNC